MEVRIKVISASVASEGLARNQSVVNISCETVPFMNNERVASYRINSQF